MALLGSIIGILLGAFLVHLDIERMRRNGEFNGPSDDHFYG
jgi:hypothetical protein